MKLTQLTTCLVGASFLIPTSFAQTSFSDPNFISNSANGAWSIFTGDIDGDGDLDVLSASGLDNKVAWYENDGASFSTWIERPIALDCITAHTVRTGDLDGDGDLDVIASANSEGKIYWYENDGLPTPGWTTHTIASSFNAAQGVSIADIDEDGDLDVLSASWAAGRVAWFENQGGGVWVDHTVSSSCPNVTATYLADLDSDGDIDALAAYEATNQFFWYESDGQSPPNWTSHALTSNILQPRGLHAGDVNNDGFMDVLTASENDNKIAWHQNDGQVTPGFTEMAISSTATRALWVYSADLDNDGDLDVLSSSHPGIIAWYENDGALQPSWVEHEIDTGVARSNSVHAADLTGDGFMDVITCSWGNNQVLWYENAAPARLTVDYPSHGRHVTLVLEEAEGPIVYFFASTNGTGPSYLAEFDVFVDLGLPVRKWGARTPDGNGMAVLRRGIPPWYSQYTLWVQCVYGPLGEMTTSNLVLVVFP